MAGTASVEVQSGRVAVRATPPYQSALAFGTLFARAGWLLGTARIAHRIWQVYWVHIGIFLLVLAGTCVIFGMGLPSLPAYILVATFGAPALVQAGVPVLAAHLFVMYFAISSGITPPVCLVAYAGAAIADAPPMKTAKPRKPDR